MDIDFDPTGDLTSASEASAQALRERRDAILAEWVERVRAHELARTGRKLSEPLLLDHVPALFDAMLDRLELFCSRDEERQHAAVHGFTRRLSGYDAGETVRELVMFRSVLWHVIGEAGLPPAESLVAMERIDGMVDRAIVSSLEAFGDPGAQMLRRETEPPDPLA